MLNFISHTHTAQLGFIGAGRLAEACSKKASGPCGSSVGFLCWTLISSNTCCQWWILVRCFCISISFLWSSFLNSDMSCITQVHICKTQKFLYQASRTKSLLQNVIWSRWDLKLVKGRVKLTSFSTCSGFWTDSWSLFWRKKHSVCLATSRNLWMHWSTPIKHIHK